MPFNWDSRKADGWSGRRSAVLARRGMVATSQPLAAQAGLRVLQEGGNAVDAAVTAAATLAVVEPHMTGVGGDLFALVYAGATGRVHCLNASGRAPGRATVEALRGLGLDAIPPRSIFAVTVPGAVSGWAALLDRFGTIDLARALGPAVGYAEDGFPVSEVVASQWLACEDVLAKHPATAAIFLPNGRPPRLGEIVRNPDLAGSLRLIARDGPAALYGGEIGAAIAWCSRRLDGFLDDADLAGHTSNWVEPVWSAYRGYTILEAPPNAQGVTALEMLNILEQFDLAASGHNSVETLHRIIEAKKLAYADRNLYVADPTHADLPTGLLASKAFARRRSRLIGDRAASYPPGPLDRSSDTVVVVAVDRFGNGVSLINSLFNPFGSGIVADGTGIVLQNRGCGFSLTPGHRNVLAPGKRPLHTLIPAMALERDRLALAFGVMGGDMQAQGHAQVLANLIDFGLSLQEALDAPRVRHLEGDRIYLDAGLPAEVEAGLAARGHRPERAGSRMSSPTGGAQAIAVDQATGVLAGASDWRKDGCAVGF